MSTKSVYRLLWLLFALLLAVTLVAAVIMKAQAPDVDETKVKPPGVVMCLEFAKTPVQAQDILKELDACQKIMLLANTLTDFLFLTCYSLLFVVSLLLLYYYDREQFPPGALVAIMLLPGILDVIENGYILHFIAGDYDCPFWVYILAVRIKWILALVLMFLPVAAICLAVVKVYRRLRKLIFGG